MKQFLFLFFLAIACSAQQANKPAGGLPQTGPIGPTDSFLVTTGTTARSTRLLNSSNALETLASMSNWNSKVAGSLPSIGTNVAINLPLANKFRTVPQLTLYTNTHNGGMANVNAMVFGNSVATLGVGTSPLDSVADYYVSQFNGCGGYSLGGYKNLGIITLTGGSAFLPPDTNWYGQELGLANGGTATWTNNNNPNGGFRANVIGLWYLAGSNQGTFTFGTNVNGGAYTTVFTVNANQPGIPVVLYTNVTGLSATVDSSLRVTGTSGSNILIGAQMYRTGTGEAVIGQIAYNGQHLDNLRAIPVQSFLNVLTNINPSVIFYSIKQNPGGGVGLASVSNNVVWFDQTVSNALPKCDIVYVGPYPDASDTNANYIDTRIAESDSLQACAALLGRPFVQLEHFWTYGTLTNLGLMLDGTHMNIYGSQVAGSYILNQIAPVFQPAITQPVRYTPAIDANGELESQVIVGTPPASGAWGKLIAYDVRQGLGGGIVQLGSPANGVGAIDFTPTPTKSLNTPSLMGDGANTWLQASSANGDIFLGNRNNVGLVNGYAGGVNTNGGWWIGNNGGGSDETVPSGMMRSQGFLSPLFTNYDGYMSWIKQGTNQALAGFNLFDGTQPTVFFELFPTNGGIVLSAGNASDFDGARIQAYGGASASFTGNIYLDYGSQYRLVPGRSLNIRLMSGNTPTNALTIDGNSLATFAGFIVSPDFNTPTNPPADGNIIVATGTGGASKWGLVTSNQIALSTIGTNLFSLQALQYLQSLVSPNALTNNDTRNPVIASTLQGTNNSSAWMINPTGTNVQFAAASTNAAAVRSTNTVALGGTGYNLQVQNTNQVNTLTVTQDGALALGTNNQAGMTAPGVLFGNMGLGSNLNYGAVTGGIGTITIDASAIWPGDTLPPTWTTNTPGAGSGAIQGSGPSVKYWQVSSAATNNLLAQFTLPSDYDGGAINASVLLVSGTNFGPAKVTNVVSFAASARGAALGTAITTTNTLPAGTGYAWTNIHALSLTVGGTPKPNDSCTLQVSTWGGSPYWTSTNNEWIASLLVWYGRTNAMNNAILMP